jgi:hypothetical protein
METAAKQCRGMPIRLRGPDAADRPDVSRAHGGSAGGLVQRPLATGQPLAGEGVGKDAECQGAALRDCRSVVEQPGTAGQGLSW